MTLREENTSKEKNTREVEYKGGCERQLEEEVAAMKELQRENPKSLRKGTKNLCRRKSRGHASRNRVRNHRSTKKVYYKWQQKAYGRK